jgi:hypothetical protein
VTLFSGCRALTHVDVKDCGRAVTDKMMVALGESCAGLKTAILVNAEAITVRSLRALAKGCKGLETLDLAGMGRGGVIHLSAFARTRRVHGQNDRLLHEMHVSRMCA